MPRSIQNISLDDLMQDPRVQNFLRKREREIKVEYRDRSRSYHSQIFSCHAWLLLFHYEVINRLRDDYKINRSEFIVLMGAYVMKRLGNYRFKAREVSHILLPWESNRIYRQLRTLEIKGYIHSEKSNFSKINLYTISSSGERVIRAFSQHFWQFFDEVRGKIGDLPVSFEKLL